MAHVSARFVGADTFVGGEIGQQHLGANYLFNRVAFQEAIGTGAFDETAAALGITHLRYPGGTMAERQFDPANPDNTRQSTDLTTGEAIASANRVDLTPMSQFLAYAAEAGIRVSMVVPTARYIDFIGTPSGRGDVADEIATFVQEALQSPHGHVIETFEIGNEWQALGMTAAEYGRVADVLAIAIADGISAAKPAGPPMIALQTSPRAARLNETNEILDQLSTTAKDAIDAAIIHNYRPVPWEDAAKTAGKFSHVDLVEQAIGRPVEVLVTEWNIGNQSDMDGLAQAAGLLEMFDQMVRLGMDRAHIWPLLENNTTALAADVADPQEPADLLIGGEIYRQMVQSLPGLTALNIDSRLDTDTNGETDLLLHAFGGASGGGVVFMSSVTDQARDVALDLSAFAPILGGSERLWITRLGVADGTDPLSPYATPLVSAVALGPEQRGLETPLTINLAAYETVRLEFSGPGLNVVSLVDTPEFDDFRLSEAAEVIALDRDGARDLVRDFDVDFDRLDVSALGVTGLEGLEITERVRRDGSVNWLEISEQNGPTELFLRFDRDTPLEAARLTTKHFIFATEDAVLRDTVSVTDDVGITSFRATAAAEIFEMANDDSRDLIRGFDTTRDVIDVSAWGITAFDQLSFSVQRRKDGTANWLNILDGEGQAEVAVRFASHALTADALHADNFVFALTGDPGPTWTIRQDGTGVDSFKGTREAEQFVMMDDGMRDLLRGFEPGVDVLDLSDFNLSGFSELTLRNQHRKDGSINWVQIFDGNGELEVILKLAGVDTDAANLSADNFLF